jgi:glycosyltransferase involved in cell wall biosynthesis
VKNPRILFVSHEATRTGAPILLLRLLRWLRLNTPWHMELLLRQGGELADEFSTVVPTNTLPAWGPEWNVNVLAARLARRRLVARLLSQPWSLVYSNTIVNGDVLQMLAGPQPVISHVHELATTIRAYGDENFQQVCRHTTRFIACANVVKQDLTSCGIRPDRVDVVHEFVEAPAHDAADRADARRKVLRELGIPEHAFVVGAAGFVTWRKAPDVFIALAHAVSKRCPEAEVHFVWVGALSGPISGAEVHHDVRGLGLEGRVHFIGSRPNALQYFPAFDVFAMVSREDPFPLVCLEAASVATPIVCFDYAGGMKEFVEDDCGFVLPYQDLDAMASAVLKLRELPALRQAQGLRAAEKVRFKYDIDVVAPKIVAIVERLIASRHPSAMAEPAAMLADPVDPLRQLPLQGR